MYTFGSTPHPHHPPSYHQGPRGIARCLTCMPPSHRLTPSSSSYSPSYTCSTASPHPPYPPHPSPRPPSPNLPLPSRISYPYQSAYSRLPL